MDSQETETISTRGKHFHCDLCDVRIASDQAVQDHLKGKKHQRLTAIKVSRQKQAECSIFVGGLTKLVSELELTDYFSKYGSVAQVIVDKDKGKYAIVEFTENTMAEKAAETEKQKMNGKKITVRPRECKLVATKSKQHVSQGKQAKTAKEKELDTLLERLTEEENVCSQMTTLMERTCLGQSDLQLRYLICDLLLEVFVEVFPKCRVFPYGSSVSGFGVKGCDLDLQVDLGHDAEQFRYRFASMPQETSEEDEEGGAEDMDTSEEQAGTSGSQPDTSNMANEEILALFCRLLKQCVPSCQHVRVIPSSRRPVIKFIHKESGLHCDLSLNNRLALRNTELLHFCSRLDARVRPLVFAIRLWAKQHQLAGNQQGPGPKLTNYALTMLVVHYLQNTQLSLLPTPNQLRQLADADDHAVIDGWNCSFTTDDTKIHRQENNEDIESLLKGFFSFYTKLDFATSVLCPATGSTTPLMQFLQETQQSAGSQDTPLRESSREFKVGPVNIQDPLELTHNIAANVNDKVAERLRAELRKAQLTCISLRYRKQAGINLETGKVPRWGLLSLLEEKVAGGGKGQKESIHSIIIPLKMSQVTQEFMKSFQDEQEMKIAWCQHVEDFAQRLISDVLRMNCSAVDPKTAGEDSGESSMQTTPQKQEITEDSPTKDSMSADMDDDVGGGGDGGSDDIVKEDSCIIKDAPLSRDHDDDDEEVEGPVPKRQRLDTSLDADDHHNMSVTSSGDTSLSSLDNLTSPASVGSSTKCDGDRPGFMRAIICKTNHAVWVGRRKLRRKLQALKPWGDATIDEVTREKYITEELVKSTPSGSEDMTEFKLILSRKLERDLTAVALTFRAMKNEVNVSNFRHFFEEFISKMLLHTKV